MTEMAAETRATVVGLAAIFMWAALAQLRPPWAPGLAAFVGIFLYHALYFTALALALAPATQANLINYLWPLLIVLLAAATGPGLHPRHVAGSLLGLAGTALILLGPSQAMPVWAKLPGYAAAASCAIVWATYSVINRHFRQVPSTMLVGVCAAVALAGGLCHLASETTVCPGPGQALAVLAIGLGPTGPPWPRPRQTVRRGSKQPLDSAHPQRRTPVPAPR